MSDRPGQRISGVILAGGANKRFGGRIKANEIIGGRKIIDRTLDVLDRIFDEIILVTNTPDNFRGFDGIITGDYFMEKGPLGGIHASMKASGKDAVFIFAGDMPFLSRKLITDQIAYFETHKNDVVIPAVNGKPEPLHGIYSNSLLYNLEEFLSSQSKLAIKDFLSGLDVGIFEVDGTAGNKRAFTNINTALQAREAENK